MNIILSNYRYFVSGGPERYLFSIKSILESYGNNVHPFSVRSSLNEKTPYESMFLSPISSDAAVYFEEYNKTIKTSLKILSRQFYDFEGFIKARNMAKRFKSDIVYMMHFLNKMSPSVIDGFKSVGLPVVVRISDFEILCPQAHLLCRGEPCYDCIERSKWFSIPKKCVKNSCLATFIKVLASRLHSLVGSLRRIDAFVFPSAFTMELFIRAGIAEKRCHLVPTHVETTSINQSNCHNGYILYFGRFTYEKGLHVLLEAHANLSKGMPKLIAIGSLKDSDYAANPATRYTENVEFLEFMPKEQLDKYITRALCVVIPSICIDNLPNALLEAFAHGKMVIAPLQGCFPDLIVHGKTGWLYQVNDISSLSKYLLRAIENPNETISMGQAARRYVEKEYSPQHHYTKLLNVFQSII